MHERGLALVGRTLFPVEALPDAAALAAAGVDTVVLFAGDGTINAAACALDRFEGTALILPGGTMNMLARVLHGDADAATIIAAAHEQERTRRLPLVEAGPHRAFVAAIIGPAAQWGSAREAARHGRLRRMVAAARLAWQRSFSRRRRVRVLGTERLGGAHQALIAVPGDAEHFEAAAITATRLLSLLRLGAAWLTDDWRHDPAVSRADVTALRLAARRTIPALFDGEPVNLPRNAEVRAGESRLRFITVRA
ncbi:Diacylglycerol kinase family enzyme [Sphingomonas guangdongensis]|uniref:Diacylglycerol kinase family enzyme n=2 Tax=Sphingomonas guangdongensis TaxID=1141890 RepID=A0A285R1P4_9SPHN|nr:Diacylglycerol kinase family enzyme [Sphingomonas guangdongensis]